MNYPEKISVHKIIIERRYSKNYRNVNILGKANVMLKFLSDKHYKGVLSTDHGITKALKKPTSSPNPMQHVIARPD